MKRILWNFVHLICLFCCREMAETNFNRITMANKVQQSENETSMSIFSPSLFLFDLQTLEFFPHEQKWNWMKIFQLCFSEQSVIWLNWSIFIIKIKIKDHNWNWQGENNMKTEWFQLKLKSCDRFISHKSIPPVLLCNFLMRTRPTRLFLNQSNGKSDFLSFNHSHSLQLRSNEIIIENHSLVNI